MNSVQIRRWQPTDNISDITELLHRAYAPLAEQGMSYLASHQNEETTLKRLSQGESYLAIQREKIVATVTLYPPSETKGCPWYEKAGVAKFGQFAVAPELQGQGIGKSLMDFIESRAIELAAIEIALDTSEHAHRLISTYKRRGYRFVEYTRWEEVNYRSVILSKALH